jgi:GAF domain-containing protein
MSLAECPGVSRRFVDNAFVKDPGVRFYVGTPLVASDGQRLGTLCFADMKPREFDAGQCCILNNMSELVVREIEREWATAQAARERRALQQVCPPRRSSFLFRVFV